MWITLMKVYACDLVLYLMKKIIVNNSVFIWISPSSKGSVNFNLREYII